MKITRQFSHRCAVFLLTFFSYAFFHANRKAFSNVKTSTGNVWTPSFHNATLPPLKPDKIWNSHTLFNNADGAEHFQGILDTAFMAAYAVGLFLNGYIGDRVNMRILLAVGMAGTSVTVFVFGCVCEWASYYNIYFYAAVWIINGFLQSTGWPVVVACMGNWFGKSSRGVLLGLWSSCASVGNIIGALMVASVLSYGYQYAFLMTSCVLLSGSFMVFFGLVPSPEDVGLERSSDDKDDDDEQSPSINTHGRDQKAPLLSDVPNYGSASSDEESSPYQVGRSINPEDGVSYEIQATRPASISFWSACLLPGVIPYSLAYAFLKLVNYSFFFWLPFYLSNAFHWSESFADKLSTLYDVAGIVGGTIAGFISDRVGKRTVLIVPMLLVSIPSLLIYSNSPNSFSINSALMFLVGFFIGGAANLISSAVSADLGCQKQLRGNDRALATVTGVIDGTGSVGAALGQIAVPYLQTGFNWHAVFYLFMICMFLTAVCLFPLFFKEIRSLKCFSRCRQRANYPTVQDREYLASSS
ncbi:unnamed protein product [Candidula unifasciata]|uniref:Sugar phosphate exchanger 3 n=1 Tax=Candidula unifasciata TaxID=100452 RepID=A0A8S3YY25_9EUPU|nr:unnamed protein product [Candidula unifasciata]